MGDAKDFFYEVLNIPKHSTADEIRQAYRTLVRRWHPDKHPLSSKHQAEINFKSVTQAYKVGVSWLITTCSSAYIVILCWLCVHFRYLSEMVLPVKKKKKLRRCGNRHIRCWGTSSNSITGKETPIQINKEITSIFKLFLIWINTRQTRIAEGTLQQLPMNSINRRGNTRSKFCNPIPPTKPTVFYQRKPPPIEKRMECSLEELFWGCKKEVRYIKDVAGSNGYVQKISIH